MAKLTLTPVTTFSNGSAVTTTNANYVRIADAIENTLSRDGEAPNQMNADLDMNSNDILNAKDIEADSLTLGGVVVIPSGVVSLPGSIMSKATYDPQTIEDDAFDLSVHTGQLQHNSNLPTVPTNTIKGRISAGTGNGQDLTVDQVVELLGLTYIKDLGSHSIALRKFRTTYVDPSDWTSVLQAAGDSGERAIRVHADAEVTASDQWSIDTDGQKWIGEAFDFKSQIRRTTVSDEPFILVRGERQGMRHLGIKCNSNSGMTAANIGILVARPVDEPTDLDFEFREGYLSGFYYGAESRGRGFSMFSSLVSDVRYGINLDWPAAGTYEKDRFVGDQDELGFRRIRILGNEFHSIEVAGVRNRGWNAGNIHIVMSENSSNFGKLMFAGYLGTGSTLRDNSVTQSSSNLFQLDGGKNYFLLDNFVTGDLSVPASQLRSLCFITMTGQHTGFVIDGFKGVYSTGLEGANPRGAIDMRSGDFKGILRDIDLMEVGQAGETIRDAITIIGTGANTEILVDGITLRNTVATRSVVRMDTAGSTLKHRGIVALGAATPATSGSGTITAV